jgi:hypothetical protein
LVRAAALGVAIEDRSNLITGFVVPDGCSAVNALLNMKPESGVLLRQENNNRKRK